jgi:DNA-binding response OmpR family regulator
MVVEDDVEMNELQRELLAIHGLDAVAAYTGPEALAACRSQPADAVLLDIMLPEMDGFETCRRLRECDGRSLPIVIVTALDNDDCRRRGFEVGANAYFAKPFDPDEVVATLRKLIAQNASDNGERSPR